MSRPQGLSKDMTIKYLEKINFLAYKEAIPRLRITPLQKFYVS
jgi:hypothetical protein